ncbi:ABC transporter substrate-binding protein [Tsukamurella sp. 1534]|uniref:ABC transporter substrate-binding protein n=1 Tax=Tsukamurella sp. 1534 TaxID=1151061 RepID=UPI0002D41D8B|nr:ABC transporter substrate-binding protein [Tsukamurella sp. 1534]
MNLSKRIVTCAAAGVLAASGLTACGGSDTGADDGTFSLGTYPNSILSLPTAVAEGEKLFEAEGLKVTRVDAKTGPEIVAALIGGTTQIAGGSTGTVIPALGQGQDLRVLPVFQGETKVIMVTGKSGVTSLAGLAGKRLAIPVRGGDAETYANEVIREGGADPSTITYVAAGGPPAIAAAVMNGEVDGAIGTVSSAELMRSKGADVKVIAAPQDNTAGERGRAGLSGFNTTTAAYFESHPKTVNSLCKAMIKAATFIADPANKEKVVGYIATWVGLPKKNAEVVWESEHKSWFTTLDQARWDANVKFAGGKPVSFDKVVNTCGQN